MGSAQSKQKRHESHGSASSVTPLTRNLLNQLDEPTSPSSPTSPETPSVSKTPRSFYKSSPVPSDSTCSSPLSSPTPPYRPQIHDITRPPPPREITRLSRLLDPADLIIKDWSWRSPSGNLLGPNGYFNHPARPLSLRERQEQVRKAIKEKSSLGQMSYTRPETPEVHGGKGYIGRTAPVVEYNVKNVTPVIDEKESQNKDIRKKQRRCCWPW